MILNVCDTRCPLKERDTVEMEHGKRFVIEKYIGAGGFSLMYLAREEGSGRYVALKELFPQERHGAVSERKEDGRIVMYRPLTEGGEDSDDTLWDDAKEYFAREVRLTAQAGMRYDRRGNRDMQNDPDVLRVEGPMTDVRGNVYLVVDTYQGEALRDIIERGFIRDENGTVQSNRYIQDVLDILIKTTKRLSHLHGDCHMYHLDLSPDNIYIAKAAGGTAAEPHIIDYGSAVLASELAQSTANYPLTCNPYSAPEVLALAELQSAACGYTVDESSDTYSLASILFYAATGRVFSSALRMFGADWKEQIRREYASGIPIERDAAAFSERLIAFFEKGLAANQRERYVSAKKLCDELQRLKQSYQAFGNLLPLIGPDELMSYMVMDKHPLYQFRAADGDIHVLCLGSGVFVKRMILSLLSCGQMANAHLNIHIVSADTEQEITRFFREKAPSLEIYSNLSEPTSTSAREHETEYVTFHFERVPDLLDEETCRHILAAHSMARYLIISLGRNNSNIDAANLYARCLAEQPNPMRQKAVVNYYCAEDAANNTRASVGAGELPAWIEIDAFGDHLSSYGKTLKQLGSRTLRIAHLYNRLGNPRIALTETAKRLMNSEYDQRSSCAAALHLKYKLASVGINPAPTTNKRAIISAYCSAISGDGFEALLELEHRRWMMYMIADGYRLPTVQELGQYGFEMCDGRFNGAWKCKAKRLHPCLVPCSRSGIVLKRSVWERFFGQTADKKKIEAEIEHSEFDELDKMSLKLHLLALKKCEQILRTGRIDNAFHEIREKLAFAAREAREEAAEEQREDPAALYEKLQRKLLEVQETVTAAAARLCYTGRSEPLKTLRRAFDGAGINISEEIEQLERCLSVFSEYAADKDYKAPDAALIKNLLWILYADETTTLIKLPGRTVADNITGPLVVEPRELVFLDLREQETLTAFMRGHGYCGRISFRSCAGKSVAEVGNALEKLIAESHQKCVLDISGADEVAVIAAQQAALKHDRVAVMRSTPDGSIENIIGFPFAPIYTLNTAISADEIYALHGATEIPAKDHYMIQLLELVPRLWSFYREFRNDWEMITAFFAHPRANGSDIWISNYKIGADTVWKPFNRTLDKAKWEQLGLQGVFEKMTNVGFIRELCIKEPLPGRLSITFTYPCAPDVSTNDFIFKCFLNFFSYKVPFAFAPFRCEIRVSQENEFTIDIRSGCMTDLYDRELVFSDKRKQINGGDKEYSYALMAPALKRLEELELIFDLKMSELTKGPVSIRFFYTNLAIRECLTTAGNVLELYVWSEAMRTREFDDCKANFSFLWREGIKNELDVILTKGLASLVISCKTAKFNKEHLYEVKYLTDRFSLNSKPVIVYSSDKAIEDGGISDDLRPIKDRAEAMGIYLIDLNERDHDLGERLVRIMADRNKSYTGI